MKTSKRLLSFFLAVVMIVTTCSIGFTAFAAEKNKSIWSTDADAQSAFKALNGMADDLLPSLLMGVAGEGVYKKIAKEMGKDVSQLSAHEREVIKGAETKEASDDSKLRSATLKDILQALQPTVIGALAGKSQSDFVRDYLDGKYAASNYDYLNGLQVGGMDYFKFVSFCMEYVKADGVDAQTQAMLREWLFGKADGNMTDYEEDSVWRLAKLYEEQYAIYRAEREQAQNKIDEIADRFGDKTTATLYQLKHFDFKLTQDEKDLVEANIEETNAQISALKTGIQINDLAEMIYYTESYGRYEISAASIIDLILLGGGSADVNGTYDLGFGSYAYNITGITPQNYLDKAIEATLANAGVPADEFSDEEMSEIRAKITQNYLARVLYATDDEQLDSSKDYLYESPYYVDAVKGLAAKVGGADVASIEAKVEPTLLNGTLTEEELDDMASVIAGRTSSQEVQDYLLKGECTVTVSGNEVTATLPAALAGTYTASYFATVLANNGVNEDYMFDFLKSFVGPNHNNAVYESSLDIQPIVCTEVPYDTFYEIDTKNGDGNIRGRVTLNSANGSNSVMLTEGVDYTTSKTEDGQLIVTLTDEGIAKAEGSSTKKVYVRYATAYRNKKPTTFRPQLGTVDVLELKYDLVLKENGLPIVADRSTDVEKFNKVVNDAKKAAYSQAVASILGASLEKTADSELQLKLNVESIHQNRLTAGLDSSNIKIELTEEQKAVLNGDFDLVNDMGSEILNKLLNDKVGSILDPSQLIGGILSDLVEDLLDGAVDLQAAIDDIWMRLIDDPLGTVFELLPLLVTLVDNVIIPVIFNDEGDKFNNWLFKLLKSEIISGFIDSNGGFMFNTFTLKFGSFIGIDQLGWDLNTLLPQVLDWVLASDDAKKAKTVEGISYYEDVVMPLQTFVYVNEGGNDTAQTDANGEFLTQPKVIAPSEVTLSDFDHYEICDENGYILETVKSDDSESVGIIYKDMTYNTLADAMKVAENDEITFRYITTYSDTVPYLTGIYMVDKMLKDATLDDLYNILPNKLNNEELGTMLAEVIDEVAHLFEAAVDEFVVSDYAQESRYKSSSADVKRGTGLNNIFVAIPRLFDLMEDKAAEKYSSSADAWTYCYEGRIAQVENNFGNISTQNVMLEKFKSYMSSSDKNRKYDILDVFAEVFVEGWLNAILSLVDIAFTGDNEIANNIPIISGLLKSLGGFGEMSILTDIFNSVFQLTRDSKYSFDFTNELTNENNKLTGFTKDNAFFLLSNIDRLIEVIQNLIAHFGDNKSPEAATLSMFDDAENETDDDEDIDLTPVINPAPAAKATASKYSSSDLSNTKDLINNLDKMLSSLLSDSTLNGFSLNSAENIISGVVSLLDRFLGNDVDLGDDLKTDIVKLVNQYLYFVTGESQNLTAQGKNVDPKKVYTNNALTGLVVETYALIEKLADRLLVKFYDTYDNDSALRYNLLVEAIDGVIAPDAVGIRLADYENAQKSIMKYNSWTIMSEDCSRHNYRNLSINWGIKAGDKDAFYDGLSSALRLVTSILGVLLIDTGWYGTVVEPILGALCDKNGVKVTPYETLVADKEATGYYDETLIAILSAFSGYINALLKAPANTLIKTVQGIAGILDDKNTDAGTIGSIAMGALSPLAAELNGAASIFSLEPDNGLKATSPTLADKIGTFAVVLTLIATPSGLNIGDYEINGENLIPIINSLISFTGIELKQISWSKLYNETPEGALVYVLEYLIETLLDNENLTALAGLIDNDVFKAIVEALQAGKIDAKGLLTVLDRVLEATDSPTLAYWTFAQYLQELTQNFTYPAGITKAMADKGVPMLDNLVANIFPLLTSFGVKLGADDLKGVVDKNLFKNEMITKLAVALYGALDGLDPTIKAVLKSLGIVTSTKDVAAILTDASYGATYSSAANTIKAQSSWKNVKNVNWGFTDGSGKAQQGFVNALVAVLRPLDSVLNVFLNEGELQINDVAYDALCALNVAKKTKEFNIGGNITAKITYSMNNGVFTVYVDDANRANSAVSEIKIDLKAIKAATDLKIGGTNGYNSAIIPLLEAFKLSGIKTYSEYQNDVSKAKDNLLLDILNPIAGASDNSLINQLLDKPFAVLTDVLPNVAMYLDAHGLSQAINNILAPVTGLVADINKVINIDSIVKAIAGKDLSSLISSLINNALGLNLKLNVDLSDLSKLNIEDLIYPLVTTLISGSNNAAIKNLKLFKIDFNALISLGTKGTYTSKATGADGKFLTGKTINDVDQGKVLITALRYIAKTLIANATTLKNLITGIDKVKKSDVLTAVISSVFNTIGMASPDQLVSAIFYLVSSQPENAFWNYSEYKTGTYEFSYPEGVDVDFLKNLPPMLDGLISGLIDLNEKIGEVLFKDELISKLAKGLYGAIEGVKVGDGTLTGLLAQTGIDFSTANVANLLVDKKYGQSFENASAAIRAAGSWKNVNADALKWGVTDRDSFFHALVAVLRPIYPVLDVLLNDAYLGLFDLVRLPGSNGYTSSIVPLMEAFSMYNVKTQYQYRQDMSKEYDAILLDIINPLWDLVEDVLAAPLQTVAAIIPNLALFIGNNGLCQIIDNLLTPVSALADAIRPIVDLNDLLTTLLSALKVDLNGILAKVGVRNFTLDIYDLNKTLKPLLGADSIIPLINNVLGLIKIKGTPLALKLNDVDWLKLASHGTTIVSASQAATYGARIFVEGDSSETLIAVLAYLIETVNAGDNFDKISDLVGGLLGDDSSDKISDMVGQVLGMLQGDTDAVIASLVELLQTLA